MTMPLNGGFLPLVLNMIKSDVTVQRLDLKHVNICHRDKSGKNALFFSIENKNSINTKLLVESGVPLMVTPAKHALFHAIECDDIESVKLLINKGIDIDTRDSKNRTPLMCAIYHDRLKIFQYLLNKQANLFSMDCNHDMAIDYAYKRGTMQMQEILHWWMIAQELQEEA